jgi:hypothetical protein
LPFVSLKASFDPCTHRFQPLLKLLILRFELLDPGRNLAQLSLHSIQST